MHHIVHAATLPEAYHQALSVLNNYGEIRPCPAYNTREKSISVTVDIARPMEEPRISKLSPCDPAALQQYLMEMEEGIMDFEYTITGNWPYTYHNRMIEQLVEVVKILKKDIYSRRAVVVVRHPGDITLDDPPCLQMIQYIVNNGHLDCFVTFRSNDAVKAFFMNAFALIDIQRIISEILNIKLGRYIHTADSFHAYENDWDKLSNFTERIKNARGAAYQLALPFKGDWEDMMVESIPDIDKKLTVQMQKHNVKHHGYYVGSLKDILERELE